MKEEEKNKRRVRGVEKKTSSEMLKDMEDE